MKIGHFDCFAGAAGDMIVAALIDAGCELGFLQETVDRLGLPGVSLGAERVDRGGLSAIHAVVRVEPGSQKSHRHLPQILDIIRSANLSGRVGENAESVFRRLAEAEAKVHGTSIEKVHFHEVGAADAIVDIVCACAGIEALAIDRLTSSPIPTGSGTVRCEHGVMPVPAPATAELLAGFPVCGGDEPHEMTTPTGAALLTTLCVKFGPLPEMRLQAVGCGAGTRTGVTRPNFLRLLIGETAPSGAAECDTVVVLNAQLDDVTGQTVGYACQCLLEAGALDAYIVPIIMKKSRPGHLLTVLCRPADVAALEAVVFAETGTLGIRRHLAQRSKLPREIVAVETRFGTIRVKVGLRSGGEQRAWPEYEDCAAAARAAGVPLETVQQEALHTWMQQHVDGRCGQFDG